MKAKHHKELDIWNLSMDLVVDIYRVTSIFPAEEKYGLVSQMRRAAVSIASNIAEGASRNYKSEFSQFMYIALGSISEVETQLEISRRLGYIQSVEELNMKLIRIRQMGLALIARLKA